MKDKIEVIIYSDDKILIQDISFEPVVRDWNAKIRIPSQKELLKIQQACTNSILGSK